MRIPSNNFSQSLNTRLQQLTAQQSRLQEQISTGQRITKLSDDPAAAARVLNLQADNQRLDQFSRNNDKALNISTASYEGLRGLKSVSDRASEIATLGTGPVGTDARKAYAAEADQLLEQALQAANTQFAGEYMFGGTKSDAPPFTATRDANGKITSVAYTGAADTASFKIGEGPAISPFTNGTSNSQLGDFMNRLAALRDGLQAGDETAITSSKSALALSEDDLLDTMSNLSAVQTRLEASATENETRRTEIERQTGNDVSADYATSVLQMKQAETSYQAALQSGAKIMQMSILDYVR